MTIVVNKVYTIILTINANIIGCNTFTTTNIHCCIRIDKPLNLRIIVPALQVVHSDFFVEIITSVAERVDICNVDAVGRLCAGDNAGVGTPSIIAISADDATVLVGDCNDVSLQVLLEVVGHIVVDDTADRPLIALSLPQKGQLDFPTTLRRDMAVTLDSYRLIYQFFSIISRFLFR